jgi:hypothetical protein
MTLDMSFDWLKTDSGQAQGHFEAILKMAGGLESLDKTRDLEVSKGKKRAPWWRPLRVEIGSPAYIIYEQEFL